MDILVGHFQKVRCIIFKVFLSLKLSHKNLFQVYYTFINVILLKFVLNLTFWEALQPCALFQKDTCWGLQCEVSNAWLGKEDTTLLKLKGDFVYVAFIKLTCFSFDKLIPRNTNWNHQLKSSRFFSNYLLSKNHLFCLQKSPFFGGNHLFISQNVFKEVNYRNIFGKKIL